MTRNLVLALTLLLWPIAATAQQQSGDPANGPDTPTQTAPQPQTAAEILAPDAAPSTARALDDSWLRLAARAEELAMRDEASLFALNRLRAELVIWRDAFLEDSRENAARIATIDAQLEALGPVPDDGDEAAVVSARRDALIAQRRDLAAPAILADEAHARANGLITEFDIQLLQQQAAELTQRGPSPLNPTHLASAVGTIWEAVTTVSVEVSAGFAQAVEAGRLQENLPRVLLLLAVAVGLLGVGRRGITKWRNDLELVEGKLLPLWRFGLSLLQIIVPVAGLVALRLALETLDIFGLRSGQVVAVIPQAGFAIVFAWWLGRQVFPIEPSPGHLGYDAETRRAGRLYVLLLAWILGVGTLFDAALRTIETDAGTAAAIEWPVLAVMGLVLWQLGQVIRRKPEESGDSTVSEGRMRGLIGRACTVVAVVSPSIAALGFSDAGRALMIPAVMSLALAGLLFVLQRLVFKISYEDAGDDSNRGAFALLPVLMGFVIYLLSLPLFALIWGARTDELVELWTRFREGFSIGENRISPTDFLAFVVIFSLGYLLTRLIQRSLRKTVLPRTRLDLGGQNAVVAGFGYVGIILAALIAITSAGIDLSNLAIVAGALSVGIGFGLQNIVSNFVSGIILLIERPVSEGDWIEVGGKMGYVRSISVRSTVIETFDRTDVIIPNADLVSGQVINWTRGNLIGRVIAPVGVAYGSDVDQVTEILQEIAEAHPMIVKMPPPAVLLVNFGTSSLDFEIRAILRDVNYVVPTQSELNYEIVKRFAEAGIEIAFPQRDIWLRNPEALRGDKEK